MIRSAATLYALLIALLISLVCSSVILYAYLTGISLERMQREERLIDNCHSGLELLMAGFAGGRETGGAALDLFGHERDTVLLKWRNWGVYEVISSDAVSHGSHYRKSAFVGQQVAALDSFSIYLADYNNALSLAGNTRLEGNIALPEAGVKRAYIEGSYYSGDALLYGKEFRSTSKLPLSYPALALSAGRYLKGKYAEGDTVMNFSDLDKDSLYRSFSEATLVIEAKDTIILGRISLSGNIILRSETGVIVKATAQLKDIIIYAPDIIVEKGFTGSLQMIASNLLVTGENVRLLYPSALLHLDTGTDPERPCQVILGRNTMLQGSVMALAVRESYVRSVITIDSAATVQGFVFCETRLEVKGTISGKVYTNCFVLRTPSSYYVNHLMNARLQPYDRIRDFTGPVSASARLPKKIVQWIF
jgi:hypothetical protein